MGMLHIDNRFSKGPWHQGKRKKCVWVRAVHMCHAWAITFPDGRGGAQRSENQFRNAFVFSADHGVGQRRPGQVLQGTGHVSKRFFAVIGVFGFLLPDCLSLSSIIASQRRDTHRYCV